MLICRNLLWNGFLLASFLSAGLGLAYADEAPAPSPSSEPSGPSVPSTQKPKVRVKREKEAEGTQAPNRFGTDINIKSKYQYRGQPLEVDTD